MDIQGVDSIPPYIKKFIDGNKSKLEEIYKQGIDDNNEGCLFFKCSEKDNKMDVMFLNKANIVDSIQNEQWELIKNNAKDSTSIYIVNDMDISSLFIIYL